MEAYTKTISKEDFIKELKWHQAQDNFIKGTYFEDGRGCAVGCSLESIARTKGLKLSFCSHKEYEAHLGIPEWLARVEDRFFEGVSVGRSKQWPLEFAEAINTGANLEKAKIPFLIFVVESTLETFDHKKYPQSKKAIDGVLQVLKTCPDDKEKLRVARKHAADAAADAADAAAYAAYAAAADAAYAAAYAAAADAADAAAYAAYAAAYAADAREKRFEIFADKLLDILRSIRGEM